MHNSICVSFYTENQTWTLIDANTLPAIQITTDGELTRRISHAFGHFHATPYIAMDTQILTLGDYKHKVMHMIKHWHKTDAYQTANHIHPYKAFILDTVFHTNLFFRAVVAKNIDLVTHLISLGASVNTMDQSDGMTALHHAVSNNQLPMVQLLLQHGANPNTCFQEKNIHHGETPLYVAASNGNADIARELIHHGANLSFSRTRDARNPLTTAKMHGHKKVIAVLENARKTLPIHSPYLYSGLFSPPTKLPSPPAYPQLHQHKALTRG
jgi:hypothetical protein